MDRGEGSLLDGKAQQEVPLRSALPSPGSSRAPLSQCASPRRRFPAQESSPWELGGGHLFTAVLANEEEELSESTASRSREVRATCLILQASSILARGLLVRNTGPKGKSSPICLRAGTALSFNPYNHPRPCKCFICLFVSHVKKSMRFPATVDLNHNRNGLVLGKVCLERKTSPAKISYSDLEGMK